MNNTSIIILSYNRTEFFLDCIYFEIPFSSVVEVISNSRMSAAD